MRSKSALLVYLFTCITTRAYAQSFDQYEQIQGNIRFQNGEPAAQIMIELEQVNSVAHWHTITDADGHYVISHLTHGEYVIYPYGKYEEYPARDNMFLSKNPDRVLLLLDDSQVTANLTMAPKAAILSGSVVDAKGFSIPGAQVVLCHADEVDRSAEIHSDPQGRFRYIIPSGENLSVYVYSQGYAALQKTGIQLSPGEAREITFQLSEGKKGPDEIKGEQCKPFRPGG